jgi:hypothetical protein
MKIILQTLYLGSSKKSTKKVIYKGYCNLIELWLEKLLFLLISQIFLNGYFLHQSSFLFPSPLSFSPLASKCVIVAGVSVAQGRCVGESSGKLQLSSMPPLMLQTPDLRVSRK